MGQHWHLFSLHKNSNQLGLDLDAEQRTDIQAQFKAFRFWAQAYPKTVNRDVAGMFHRIFVGAELDGGWSRTPGSWWKIKHRMIAEARERNLREDLEERARLTGEEVSGLVRKRKMIMSGEWRARRREQEKRAGRWTDGTLRMDRMWEEFHWVLPSDDPNEFQWVRRGRRRVIEVWGGDIWSGDIWGGDIWGTVF